MTVPGRRKLAVYFLPAVFLCLVLLTFFWFFGKSSDPKVDRTPPPEQFDTGDIVSIGTRLEIFLDDYLIDAKNTTASRVLHSAQQREIALEFDEPWERGGCGCFNIVEAEGIYRLYYLAYDSSPSGDDGHIREVRLCYAQSSDGLIWEKPDTGLVPYDGVMNNNILLCEKDDIYSSFTVFIDTNSNVPVEEKYKALAKSERDSLLFSFTSSDGIAWEKNSILINKINPQEKILGALNTVFWDEARQRYYCYFLQSEQPNLQKIYVTTSLDFEAWTPPRELAYQEDASLFNMLTANIAPYYRAPHIYVGLPLRCTVKDEIGADSNKLIGSKNRQQLFTGIAEYKNSFTDTVLITSRNGLDFKVIEEAWMTPGAEHDTNWIYGDTYTSAGIIETPAEHSAEGADNELSLYISADNLSQKNAKLYRYTSRIDGFVSYTAAYNTQKVVTKPLVFEGSRMLLNFTTSPGGYVFVRILDENGMEFPDILYEYDDKEFGIPKYTSYKIFGDSVDREVVFTGDLAELSGRAVTLEFYLSDASIYSYKFDNEPCESTKDWQPSVIPIRAYDDFEYLTSGSLSVGSRRELLWDGYLIDKEKTTACLVANPAVKKEALFDTDKPWEGDSCDYYNIIQDVDEYGIPFFRMYYLGWNSSDSSDIRVLYAYSHDGVEWIKPGLDIWPYYDEVSGVLYEETNIILYREETNFDNFFVIKDTRDGIPENERYKAVAQGFCAPDGSESFFDAAAGEDVAWFGLWAWLSEDGVNWRKSHRILPLVGEGDAFDSLNTLVFDEETGRYMVFFRIKEDAEYNGVQYVGYRKLAACTSEDFFNWIPETYYYLDYGVGSPDFEMYTNNICKYYRAEQIFLGFPTRFNRRNMWEKNYDYLSGHEERYRKYSDGILSAALSMTETLFMTSRDGILWDRRNESWLTPGPEYEANWIYGNCYPACGLIETKAANPGQDNELSTYVFEGKYYKNKPSTLYRYTMRIDGVACYKSTYKNQKVVTKAFVFEGSELLLNFRTSAAGEIRVRLLYENGEAIEGYDSGLLFGDRIDKRVYFQKDLRALNGVAVIMEITMSDAEIYSFKFN